MARKFLYLVFLIIPAVIVAAVIWQPEALQHFVIERMSRDIAAKTPYTLSVGSVSGNVVTGFTLNDVHGRITKTGQDLITFKALGLKLDWWKLVHKSPALKQVSLVDPIVYLTIDSAGHFRLPLPPASTTQTTTPAFEIESITLSGGQVIIDNESLSPTRRTELKEIHLAAALVPDRVTLSNFSAVFGKGRFEAKGKMALREKRMEITLDDRDIDVDKLLSGFMAVPSALQLTHTGRWTLHKDNSHMAVVMDGRMADSPVSLVAGLHSTTIDRIDLRWDHVDLDKFWKSPQPLQAQFSCIAHLTGTVSAPTGTIDTTITLADNKGKTYTPVDAHLALTQGVGSVKAEAKTDGAQAAIDSSVDIPHRSAQGTLTISVDDPSQVVNEFPILQGIAGKFSAQSRFSVDRRTWSADGTLQGEKLRWKNSGLEKAAISFQAAPGHAHVDATASDFRVDEQAKNAYDLDSAKISLDGWLSAWQSTAMLKSRNGATVNFEGQGRREGDAWVIDWQKLDVAFSALNTWTSQKPGTVRITHGDVDLENFDLTDGGQSLAISRAFSRGKDWEVDAAAQSIDLASWLKLVTNSVDMNGTVNASMKIRTTAGRLSFDGFINGNIPRMTIHSIGLDITDVLLDIRGSDQNLVIQQFKGTTKKGSLNLKGQTTGTDLDVTLEAKALPLQPLKTLVGTTDATLHLTGTLLEPDITGDINVTEASYTLPPKEKKKKKTAEEAAEPTPTASSPSTIWLNTAVDVHGHWARNVWYHDGPSAIETRADLQLHKDEGDPEFNPTGTIDVVRGNYSYYGRNFVLENGEMQFTGSFDDPLLNIQANYQSEATVVTLNVTGELSQPDLKLSSNPPLSEQDIISVIVFGAPLSELRSRTDGVSANQAMLQAAGGVLGTYVSQELRDTGVPLLNFDVLNIQSTDSGDQQLTVGRYLTRRLFISYGQALRSSAEKTVTADYSLTDRWTLEGATDTAEGNHMDLLFRYPLNNRKAAVGSALPSSPFRNSLDVPNPQDQTSPAVTSPYGAN